MPPFSWARWLRCLFGGRVKPHRNARPTRRGLQLEHLETRLAPASIWSGAAGTGNWSSPANWTNNQAPTGNGDDLVFPAGITVLNTSNDLVNATFNSITISGSGYSLGGNPITLGNPATLGSGSINVSGNMGAETISLQMDLASAGGSEQVFTVNSGSALTLSGKLSGSTGAQLTKEGTGQLILTNDNSAFTGAVLLDNNAGIVNIQTATALGKGSASTTVLPGSQLQIQNVAGPINEPLVLNGQGPDNNGALTNIAGTNTWAANITLDSNTWIGTTAGTLNITGSIGDLGAGHSLAKVGSGQLILTSADSYRGTTTITLGTLTIENGGALGMTDGTSATATFVQTNAALGSGTLQLLDPTSVGFTVPNAMLVLDDSGFAGGGALENVNGNNTWTGPIILGSTNNNTTVTIGVDTQGAPPVPTSLTLSGVVSNAPGNGVANNLVKTGGGRLILTSANTYTGATDIRRGIVTAEDSQALGPRSKVNATTVENGATLEIELRNNNVADSVTNTFNKLNFADPLNLFGNGVANAGALHSVSGINTWSGNIALQSARAAIGVDPDPNPTASNGYLSTNYSLTVMGAISGNRGTTFGKFGAGQLILPTNNTYTGPTNVAQGWITAENSTSLGAPAANTGQAAQSYVTIQSGAAVHILPLGDIPDPVSGQYPNNPAAPTTLALANNFNVVGLGITHPFGLISQEGAILNLGGNNSLTGFLQLNGIAGIGVQQLFANPPAGIPQSQLALTDFIEDASPLPTGGGGITKLGSGVLDIQAAGVYSGPVDIQQGVIQFETNKALGQALTATTTTTTVESGASLVLMNTLPLINGGVTDGQEVWNEHLVLSGTGDAALGYTTPLVVPAGSDNMWRGPVTLNTNVTFNVPANTRLTFGGPIDDAGNPSVDGSDLTLTGGGELFLSGANTYRGTTFVNQGVLTVANNSALGATAHAAMQTVTLTGATANSTQFTLTFNGATTAPITYTGLPADTTTVQNALQALSTIGGVGGLVSVTVSGSVFTVTLAGNLTGFHQNAMTAQVTAGPGSASVNVVTAGAGGVVEANGAALDLEGNITVAAKPLIVQGQGISTASNLTTNNQEQWFATGPAPIASGQTNNLGNVTGRITGVMAAPNSPTDIYVSTAGGGAWKTNNGGITWQPLFDQANATTPIQTFTGAIAIAPSNPNIIYLGTGEATASPNNDNYYGSGVYISTNAGATWTLLVQPVLPVNPINGRAVSKIVVDPNNPFLIYVADSDEAVNGQLLGTGNVGVWRFSQTFNAATNTFSNQQWFDLTGVISANRAAVAGTIPAPNSPGPDDDYRVTFPQIHTTYSDISLIYTDTTNTNLPPQFYKPVLYAALGDPNGSLSNGVFWTQNPTSNQPIWYVGDPGGTDQVPAIPPTTVDGRNGEFAVGNFNPPAPFAPFPLYGTIKISPIAGNIFNTTTVYASASAPDVAYAGATVAPGALAGIFHSANGGQMWSATTAQPPNFMQNVGQYANAIVAASPTNVFVGGAATSPTNFAGEVFETSDGGASWTDVSVEAGISPHSNVHSLAMAGGNVLVGTDGGLFLFNPTTNTWADINGDLAITQFNSVAPNPTNLISSIGGAENNAVVAFNNNPLWKTVSDNQLDTLATVTGPLVDGGNVQINPSNPSIMYAAQDGNLMQSTDGGTTWVNILAVPFTNNFPFQIDGVNNSRVVVGGPFPGIALQESLDNGATWTNLSPRLPLGYSVSQIGLAQYQGPYQPDASFPQVSDQGPNAYVPGTIYAINGNTVELTKDHGQTWVNRTSNLPTAANMSIAAIAVDPRNENIAYVAFNVPVGGGRGRVFLTINGGQSWTDVSGLNVGALPDVPVWTIALDPRNGNVYVGTDLGVYVSANNGFKWTPFGLGLPDVSVRQLVLDQTQNTLTAATYGRGVFQLLLSSAQPGGGALSAISGTSVWAGPVFLAGPTTIGANGTVAIQTGPSQAQLSIIGTVSDLTPTSANTLNKTGIGNVVLAGSNTYAGITVVQQGTLVVQNPNALGSTSAGTVVNAGTTLELRSSLNAEPITLNGDGIPFAGHNTGALRSFSNNNTYNGVITLNSNATIGVDSGSTLTLASPGTIVDANNNSYTLTKELTGTLIMQNGNGYIGNTFVNQGVLNIQNGSALGASGNTTTVLDGAQVQLQTPTTGLLAGQPVVITGQTLALSGSGINGSGALENIAGNNTWQGPVTLVDKPDIAPVSTPAGTVVINVPNAGDTLTIGGGIGNTTASGLKKIGAGTLTLGGADTYTGTTEVAGGYLRIQNQGALSGTGLTDVQRISTSSSSGAGTFTLTLNGLTTIPIQFTADATTVRNAVSIWLQPAENPADLAVSLDIIQVTSPNPPGSSSPNTTTTIYIYTITFSGAPGGINQPLIATATAGGMTAIATKVASGGIGTLVDAGTALQLDLDPTHAGMPHTVAGDPVWLNGTGVAGTNAGAMENVSGINIWSGNVVLQTNSSIGVDNGSLLTISGNVQDPPTVPTPPATLTKVGVGTLVFPSANSYRGTTFINNGALDIQNPGSLGAISSEVQTVTVTNNGSAGSFILSFNGQSTAALNYGVPASGGSGATASVQNALNALATIGGVGGSVTVTSTTTTVNGNPATVYTITFGGGHLAGFSLPLLAAVGAGGSTTTVKRVTAGSITAETQTFSLSGATANTTQFTLSFGGATTVPITFTGTAADASAIQTALNGLSTISGVGAFVDVFQSASGVYTVQFGGNLAGASLPLLSAQVSTGPGSASISRVTAGAGGTVVNSGGTLQLQNGITVASESVTLNGTGFNNTGALENVSGNNTWANSLILGSNARIAVDGASDTLAITQSITDNGAGLGVTETGLGTLDYQATNIYTGLTQVQQGSLLLDKNGGPALSGNLTVGGTPPNLAGATWVFSNEMLPGATATVLADGGLTLNGKTQTLANLTIVDGQATTGTSGDGQLTVGSLNMTGGTLTLATAGSNLILAGGVTATSDGPATITGPGKVSLNGTNRTFTVNAGAQKVDLVVNSVIAGTGSEGLTKAGNGRMQITAVETYTGPTTLNGGDLQVDGSIGNVLLNGGGLSGTGPVGTISGQTAAATGTVNPGDNGTATPFGILTSQSVTWSSGSVFSVDLSDPTLNQAPVAGTHYDQLQVNGSINLGGATLTGTATPSIPIGDRFTIIQVSGGTLSGTFAQGGTVFIGGQKFIVGYNYTLGTVVLQRVLASTTVNIKSSDNPSPYGEAIQFTVSVVPEAGGGAVPPSDTVTFIFDGTNYGATTLNANGQAIFDPQVATGAPLSVGTHSFTVNFSGDPNVYSSSTGSLTGGQVVNRATTAISNVTFSPSPVLDDAAFTVTAKVAATPPGGTLANAAPPTGTVTFSVDGGPLISVNLPSNGLVSSPPLASLSAGSHTVTIAYNGDGNYSSTSSTVSFNVVKDSPTITIPATPASSSFGQPVTFQALVSATHGSGTPTGTVTFYVDTQNTAGQVGSPITLSGGTAAAPPISTMSVGTHTIFVSYSGDSLFAPGVNSISYVVSADTTTTKLTSSATPAGTGQLVTFTATVTNNIVPGGGTPTGTVTFTVNGTPQQMGSINAQGQAVYSGAFTTIGTYVIAANFSSNNADFTNSSATLSQQVIGSTTTTLSSLANPSVFGQTLSFTALVKSTATGTPTGSVSFTVDGGAAVPETVNGSGQAVLPNINLAVGTHTVTASYSGDGTFAPSSAAPLSQVVKQASTVTTVFETTATNSVFGQQVIFFVTVSPVSGTGVPTGTVQYVVDGVTQAPVPLNGFGQAGLITSSQAVGTHTVGAIYNGTANYAGSTMNPPLSHTVNKASTTTTMLDFGPSPTSIGQLAIFIATVSPVSPGAGVPTGSIQFVVDKVALPAVQLNGNGQAGLDTSSLPVGTHTIGAIYAGDGNFAGSGSTSPIVHTVGLVQTSTIVFPVGPSPTVFGQLATFVMEVVPSAPSSFTPGGFMQFILDGVAQPVQPLNNFGQAGLYISTLPVGPHTLLAAYGGDSHFTNSGTPTPLNFNVNQISTAATLTSSAPSAAIGQNVTFTAAVGPVAPGTGVPPGTVTFTFDGGSPNTLALDSTGHASITVNTLGLGSHTVAVTYNGSTNYATTTTSITENILKASSTSISPASASAVVGQGVPFTATVTGSGGTPTGSVTFVVDGVSQPAVTLSGGQATLSLSASSAGNHSVTAVYSGDSSFAPSSPATPANLSVSAAGTTTSMLDFTGSPTVAGQLAIFIATVTPVSPGGGVPTGTLQFVLDGVVQPAVSLNGNGQAGLDIANLPAATHTVGAIFNGNANYLGSTAGNVLTHTVNKANTTTVVFPFGSTSGIFGQQSTFFMQASPVSPGGGTPTGPMQFVVDGVKQPILNLNSFGMAGLYTSSLSIGTHSISAIYYGDGNYGGSTATPISYTVNASNNAARLVGTVNGPVFTNTAFSVTAVAQDAQGNTATGFNQPAVLSVVSAPAGGFLSGNPNGTFSGGALTLSNLVVNVTGTYTINITSGGLVVTLTFTTTGRQT
jgi:autotransporter-associated beta strand protein